VRHEKIFLGYDAYNFRFYLICLALPVLFQRVSPHCSMLLSKENSRFPLKKIRFIPGLVIRARTLMYLGNFDGDVFVVS